MADKKISKNLFFMCGAITALIIAQPCLADDVPHPELGCRLSDADGSPIDSVDLSFQQRIALNRCEKTAERNKETEMKQMEIQRQNIENAKIISRSENQLAISGFQSPWRPSASPHKVPGIP